MLFRRALISTGLALPIALAQGSSDIVGCNEVGCPTGAGTTSSECVVANSTLANVGVTSYDAGLASGTTNLAWTLGISIFDGETSDPDRARYVQRSLYLGSDPALTLADAAFTGCALVFKNASNNGPVYFNNNNAALNLNSTTSDCSPNTSPDCIDALKAQAADLAAAQDASCAFIAEGLASALPSACPEFQVQGSTTVAAVPLTGEDAPAPLTAAQNGSSNCWPTLPKSNALTPVYAFNVSATAYVNSTGSAVGGVTPLMNVFFGGDAQATTELLCMQPVQLTQAAAVETDVGAGASLRVSMMAILGFVGASILAQIVI